MNPFARCMRCNRWPDPAGWYPEKAIQEHTRGTAGVGRGREPVSTAAPRESRCKPTNQPIVVPGCLPGWVKHAFGAARRERLDHYRRCPPQHGSNRPREIPPSGRRMPIAGGASDKPDGQSGMVATCQGLDEACKQRGAWQRRTLKPQRLRALVPPHRSYGLRPRTLPSCFPIFRPHRQTVV